MKVKTIKIDGFRLLNNFSIDLEDNLSLIIGKNNTGKTSFLTVLDKFLNGNKNSWNIDDFNIQIQKKIENAITNKQESKQYNPFKIQLRIYLEYSPEDNSKNFSALVMDLDAENYIYVLSFEYVLNYKNYEKLFSDFQEYKKKIKDITVIEFLNKNISKYFDVHKKVLEYADENNFNLIEDRTIKKIINLQFISAKRDVANCDSEANAPKTLSKLSYKYYDSKHETNVFDSLQLANQLRQTDKSLSLQYQNLFKPLYNSFKKFIDTNSEAPIEILSNIQETNLLKENTIVKYNDNGHSLPEDYNGLGYLNLFTIIFNIHIKLDELKKNNIDNEEPSDINLLFIEEPEAHTHPQMQYAFIKNIKTMIEQEINSDKGNTLINLQTIISTHSSHISSQSDFNDIKYFFKENANNVKVKNLSDLEREYLDKSSNNQENITEEEKEKNKKIFKFLKQYLTLNNAELFFADKAIFIEGDTERILMPAIMKKFDIEHKTDLLSQNISIVEVGNYSHIFDGFLNFLNIKTLIITDIDSVDSNNNSCCVNDGFNTSNTSIKYFLQDKTWEELKKLSLDEKLVKPNLRIAYQTNIENYHARSFEDSFINQNLDFLKINKNNFDSLKCIGKIDSANADPYDIAESCIKKKSQFATDILYYSDKNYTNWSIPNYIEEGLEWLVQ